MQRTMHQPTSTNRGTQGVLVGAVVAKPGTTPQSMQSTAAQHASAHQNTPGILQVNPSDLKRGNKEQGREHLANTKEKTPMCLVNELARYNKITHQYTLTDEEGPAHQKTFYVKLKLGGEEYAASGPSIKKAQHAAAATALVQTAHPKAPAKPPKPATATAGARGHDRRAPGSLGLTPAELDANKSITPTVELNALVMRRGEQAVYRPVEAPRQQLFAQPFSAAPLAAVPPLAQHAFHHPGLQPDRRQQFGRGYRAFPRTFYVSLKVGPREFMGEGNTRQAARHNAAEKALKVLKQLPAPPPQPAPPAAQEGDSAPPSTEDNGCASAAGAAEKSEISAVHELALKRGLSVSFDVVRESGPPHLKHFLTRCTCGNITVEGEGNSKKSSKKRAAEQMLAKLRELPPLPASTARPRKPPAKKKNCNLIKIQKASPDYGTQINPISRLIQIQQAKKEKDPLYTLLQESGKPRRREFEIQVTVGEQQCVGRGPNKKLAKRAAAEAMLQQLGYSKTPPQPAKPAIKTDSAAQAQGQEKKVTFIDQDPANCRQLVPGVIFMAGGHDGKAAAGAVASPSGAVAGGGYSVRGSFMPGKCVQLLVNHPPHLLATVARELLEKGSSVTVEALRQMSAPNTRVGALSRPEQQLLYMGDVLGFQVHFTDFPKGARNEFLSMVTLGTTPEQVSHAAGATRDASHDLAARQALRALAAFLDAPGAPDPTAAAPVQYSAAAQPDHLGDGYHMKSEQ